MIVKDCLRIGIYNMGQGEYAVAYKGRHRVEVKDGTAHVFEGKQERERRPEDQGLVDTAIRTAIKYGVGGFAKI